MKHRRISWSGLGLAAIMAVSPLLAGAQEATPVDNTGDIGTARVIGMQVVPNDLMVDDTLVGGLSSIDYNPETGQWIAISDDRSWKAPSRFYFVSLDYSSTSLNSVTIDKEVTLHQVDYALRYCDRVVALKAGRIVYDGPPAGLNRERLVDIYGPEFEDVFWEGAPQ